MTEMKCICFNFFAYTPKLAIHRRSIRVWSLLHVQSAIKKPICEFEQGYYVSFIILDCLIFSNLPNTSTMLNTSNWVKSPNLSLFLWTTLLPHVICEWVNFWSARRTTALCDMTKYSSEDSKNECFVLIVPASNFYCNKNGFSRQHFWEKPRIDHSKEVALD